MEAKPAIGLFNGLENLGMTVAQRVCRPAILEIDVALAVQVPDEVALCLIDNDLPYRTKAASPGSLHFSIESQPVTEKRNTALERGARLGTRKFIIHNVHLRRNCSS